MTTDKTPATLADAKPGGCVQLPTSERERFEAWAESSGEGLSRWPDGLYVRLATQVAWEAWQAALSAQPSPGSQGDERAQFSEWWSQQSCAIGTLLPYEIARLGWDGALAARQPVGEAIGEIVYSGEGGLQIEFYDGKPLAPMKLYAAPTAQQPAQVYLDGLDRALGEAIDQRDRYHEVADDLAGHIAAITSVDIGEHSSANCPWQNAIEAAEEYKPAQAVDLGQFNALAALANAVVHHGDESPMKNGVFAEAERLLALIESKAVGK